MSCDLVAVKWPRWRLRKRPNLLIAACATWLATIATYCYARISWWSSIVGLLAVNDPSFTRPVHRNHGQYPWFWCCFPYRSSEFLRNQYCDKVWKHHPVLAMTTGELRQWSGTGRWYINGSEFPRRDDEARWRVHSTHHFGSGLHVPDINWYRRKKGPFCLGFFYLWVPELLERL